MPGRRRPAASAGDERPERRTGPEPPPKLREWSLDDIADALADTLRERDAALTAEQAVYGLDALDEVELHPLLADGLARATPFGVLREQPYPHEWRRKVRGPSAPLAPAPATPPEALGRPTLVVDADVPPAAAEEFPPLSPDEDDGTISGLLSRFLPKPRDRMRCDLVLTPRPGQRLDDALLNERGRRARFKAARGTLFEALAGREPAEAPSPVSVPPSDALWLEVKLVGQHCYSAGVPGPNRAYAGEITRHAVTDLKKLDADRRIAHGVLALVLFTEDEATARHDVSAMLHRCLDRGLPVGSPTLRHLSIADRIGNALCTVCLVGVRKLDAAP